MLANEIKVKELSHFGFKHKYTQAPYFLIIKKKSYKILEQQLSLRKI